MGFPRVNFSIEEKEEFVFRIVLGNDDDEKRGKTTGKSLKGN
jgi:hypothetical protein